jgi:uroporphyrinogen-III synthase
MSSINLNGRLILVTRPLPEGEAFCRLIASCQGRSMLVPALEIKPPYDSQPFLSAMVDLSRYDGIIITSANGARAFLAELSPQSPPPPPIFAVGKKTAQIIQKKGHSVTVPQTPSGGEALAEAIKLWQQKGSQFLFPRAENGREELVHQLTASGYQVHRVTAYRADPIESLPKPIQKALEEGRVDAIPFFSGRTAQAFLSAFPPHSSHWLKKPLLITISPITSQAISQEPITIDLVAQQPTGEGILTSLSQYWLNRE